MLESAGVVCRLQGVRLEAWSLGAQFRGLHFAFSVTNLAAVYVGRCSWIKYAFHALPIRAGFAGVPLLIHIKHPVRMGSWGFDL